MKGKVVVAMSGGIDSSVTAYLLKEEDYEVLGITMALVNCQIQGPHSSSSLTAFEDVAKVAEIIGIRHQILDFKKEFEEIVIDPFIKGYLSGRTPNPCIVCNRRIKFGLLLDKAKRLGADLLATGHYARIERINGCYTIRKAKDLLKDQSYFLYPLSQEQLGRSLFPLGNYSKDEVRKIAKEIGLPVAKRPESQEICFIPDGDYKGFLRKRILDRPGPIVNKEGKVLGEHRGIFFYTIGQRRGLGIALRKPQYVIAIDKEKNLLIIGDEKDLYSHELIAEDVNWIGVERPISRIEVLAKIRYHHKEAPAVVTPLSNGEGYSTKDTPNRVRVEFKTPQRAITPGQSVVFYRDDLVVGGGVIV